MLHAELVPLPRVVARLNKRFTNWLIEPVVRHVPGFFVVSHVGRVSGRSYTTPLLGFDADGGVIVALTYGPHADWVKNVWVGGGTLIRQGTEATIADATLIGRSHAWPHLPTPVRLVLRVLRVSDFMLLEIG